MDNNVKAYLDDLMIRIPSGKENLKYFRDENKWISSNSQMSIPGKKGKLTELSKTVEIQSFLIAKYPVTNNLYLRITKQLSDDLFIDCTPVVNVSWYDALKFCNLLSLECGLKPCYVFDEVEETATYDQDANGYRLPTDAEWQYACKAGVTGYRYGDIDVIAWYSENSEGKLHEVGKKQPNGWGLYDMLGNSWEWCWDLYDEKTYGVYRVFRGGSWGESARGCGATCRRSGHPTFCIDDLGFRLVRSITA